MKMYRLSVSGAGEFPWDMLRFDAAFPRTTADAMKMAAPLVPSTATEERDFWSRPRTIELLSNRVPTPMRWASFNWACDFGEIL